MTAKSHETLKLTRRELYDLVWTTPIDVLATRYDISNVGLAKLCRRESVPVPPRGYWQKRAAGVPTRQSRLPTFPKVRDDVVVATLAARADAPEAKAVVCVAIREQREYEDDPAHRITVTAPLSAITRVHPLVRRTEQALRKTKYVDRGLLAAGIEGVLSVSVSAEQIDRAMCIMDALIKALDARNMPVELRSPRSVRRAGGYTTPEESRRFPRTCVRVGDQDVLLEVREHRTQIDRKKLLQEKRGASTQPQSDPYPRYDYVGSGRLVLIIPHHVGNWGPVATWTEGPRLRLEDILNDVVVGIVAAAEDFRETIARWLDEDRQREEQARLARLEQQRRAAEAARIQQLEQAAANWSKAGQLREFIAAVQAAGNALPTGVVPDGLTRDEWLQWAERHANMLDPLTHISDGHG